MRIIDETHVEYPSWGYRKMTDHLRVNHGYTINRKRVRRLMRLMDIIALFPGPNLSKRYHAQYVRLFSVTIIVRVLLRVFDRITGLNPVQVESSSSSIRGGKGEALPGCQRAATLHQDKASIPNTTHYDRSMVRRFCQRVQS